MAFNERNSLIGYVLQIKTIPKIFSPTCFLIYILGRKSKRLPAHPWIIRRMLEKFLLDRR